MFKTVLSLMIALALLAGPVLAEAPIFDYIAREDGAFGWEKTEEQTLPTGVRVIALKVVSQVWQGITWTHRVQVVVPVEVTVDDTAVLFITGGIPGPAEFGYLGMLATAIKAPLVVLGDIPNQPLYDNLREDGLIAHTFCKYLETRDNTWPLLFPMTKAAVKAMDAIEQYTGRDWATPVRRFVVTGASKRGWTTWFTGEADPRRVIGIAPLVYDNLDLAAQMAHQMASYGEYSSQIEDYTIRNLPDLLQTPQGRLLGSIVDPYTYRHRATMPKMIIAGTNDPYWVVDSANLYWDDLVGPKYIAYVPNGGHGLGDLARVLNAGVGFFNCCVGRAPWPEANWVFQKGRHLKLHLESSPAPSRVLQWTTTSPTRDFRPSRWVYREMRPSQGSYTLRQSWPAEGYAALMGEAIYDVCGQEFALCSTIEVLEAARR
jgi:PhoPQ-activated pathogenicity-related protein